MSKRLDYNQVAPAGVKALGGVYGYIMQSKLSAVLVDLVYLRVSQINNCAYCLDTHTRDLFKKGVKIEKLALVQAWREAGNLFDARERAALAWAETVTRVAETNVPDDAYQAARAVFEERELVDLTIVIGLMNAYNRMAISFRNPPLAAIEKAEPRQPGKEWQHLCSAKRPANNDLTGRINAVNLKNTLGQVEADCGNLHADRRIKSTSYTA